MTNRAYRAGQSIEDHCRSCHEDRIHTIVVVDDSQHPHRVTCDFCGSTHNYRDGPRFGSPTSSNTRTPAHVAPARDARPASPMPLVSEREISEPTMSDLTPGLGLEALLRRVIREESGLTAATPAEKWRGGDLVLKPGKPGIQEKTWPIETFFHKIVMLRNRLRTLEQQVNASALPDDQKVKLQSYITGCYGSLTSFNILFADEDDRFIGAASD